MPVVLEELGDECRQTIHAMIMGNCLDGECYAFAVVMHRCIGWPMIGLMKNGKIRHTAVIDDDGQIWDARGKVDADEFGRPFGISPPYDLVPIKEKDLFTVKPVSLREIHLISKIAQAIWPDLPWKQDTLRSRVITFAEELEKLSRKHGLWIYGDIPMSFPLIAEEEGGESGYKLGNTVNGLVYSINRVLKLSVP